MRARRLLHAFWILAVAGVVVLGSAPATAVGPLAAPRGPGDVYLALGDSLVTGDEAAINNDGIPGYPAFLRDILTTTRPIAYTNLGVSGETSQSMKDSGQLVRAETFIAEQRAAGRRVSPITLSIGGNDAVALILPGSTATLTDTLDSFRRNYREILDRLIMANSDGGQPLGDLIVMNYYNPYPGLKRDPFYGPLIGADPDADLPKFNQIIAEEAASRGVRVVDAYSAFLGREASLLFVRYPYLPTFDPGQLQANLDYHPRQVGHIVLARAFALASGYVVTLPRAYLPLVRSERLP